MKRLKYQYQQSVKVHSDDYFWKCHPKIRSVFFRKFSTQQERSFYFMHRIEYKDYPIKIRVARGTGLAYIWDDFPTYVYKYAKSWKHNSKRKSQYYKEHVK
ncbi:hypothetical protein C9426_34330 [Serratia sp. S1B]|nr:hypothetical protein C9426_34330 [Serratia sp. S1B]